jgi:hypothetical protein
MGDLDVALAKQARFGGNAGVRSGTTERLTDEDTHWPQTAANTPLPFGYAASEAGYVARQTVLSWADRITAIRAHRVPETWGEVGDYLRQHALNWIAAHPDGPQIIDELTAAIRNAHRCIDRPAERRYIGICGALIEITLPTLPAAVMAADCPEQLYALGDHEHAECPRCGTKWDVRARQDAMLNQLRDHVLNAADMARAVDGLGVDLTPERIRKWKSRGLIAPALDRNGNPRADVHGRPLYRVGDVLDIVADHASVGVS